MQFEMTYSILYSNNDCGFAKDNSHTAFGFAVN